MLFDAGELFIFTFALLLLLKKGGEPDQVVLYQSVLLFKFLFTDAALFLFSTEKGFRVLAYFLKSSF